MPASVNSVFRTRDEVTPTLRKLRTEAAKTDIAFASLGSQIDRMGSRTTNESLGRTQSQIKKLGTETDIAAAKTKVGTKSIKDSVSVMEKESTPRLDRLRAALKKIELDPIKFAAEARVIKQEIRSLESATARRQLGTGGSMLGQLGLEAKDLEQTLGGSSGGGGGGLISGMKQLAGNIGPMGAAAIFAAPAIVQLTGAVGALVGSLGAAVGGASALGVGVLGAFGVGIGGIIGIVKPATTEIKKAEKAQTAYNKAVSQYGASSKQAIAAQRNLDAAFKNHPGLRAFIGNLNSIKHLWSTGTRPGQNQLFGLLSDASGTLRRDMPLLSGSANSSVTALRQAMQPLLQLLQGQTFRQFITTMDTTFSRSLTPFADGMTHIATAFMRIADAASPYVISMFQGFDHMTANFSARTQDTAKLSSTIGGLVGQLKAWAGLMKSAGNLMFAFFGAGAKQGEGLVKSITQQFNIWATWMRQHPAEMHAFFDRTIAGAKNLAGALWQIVKVLSSLADSLQPILNAVTILTKLGGGAGVIGPLAALGATKWIMRGGVLGKLLGRGGTAAAAAGGEAAAAGGAGALGASMLGGIGIGKAVRALPTALRGGRVGMATLADTLGLGTAGGLGEAAGIGLRAAGKVALPITAMMALMDFMSVQGTFGERMQNVGHGLTFGFIPAPTTGAQARDQGIQSAVQFANQHPARIGQRVQTLTRQLRLGDITGKDKDRVQAQLKYLRGVQQVQNEQKRIMDQEAANQRRAASIARGQTESHSLSHLFGFETAHGVGATGAFADVTHTMLSRMSQLAPAGQKQLAQTYLAWAQQLKRSNPQIADQVDQLVKDLNKRMNALPGDAAVVGGQVQQSLTAAYKQVTQMMGTETERWREKNQTALTAIQRQVVSILSAMGFTGAEATGLVLGLEQGGRSAAIANNTIGAGAGFVHSRQRQLSSAHGPTRRKRGGRVVGAGMYDSVWVGGNTIGAPGELVVNRHTEARQDAINATVGAPPLGSLVAGEARPHYAARGGRIRSAVSLGGVKPGVLSMARAIESAFPGLTITSSTGGGHAANSYHYLGEALDLGGDSQTMYRAAAWIGTHMGRSLAEGIHNPNLSVSHGRRVPSSFWGPAVWSEHANHIHIANATAGGARGWMGLGGGGGMGGAPPHIHTPQVSGAGIYPIVVQRGLDIASIAGQAAVNSAYRRAGSGNLSGFTGGGDARANQALGRRMMLAAGWGAGQWPALMHLWNQESGWMPVTNPSSGAYGIPQALGHGHPYAMSDIPGQIGWGLNYIKGRYGSPAGAWAHEQRFNWYGNGGSFVARRPQVIGVGDGGAERVTVSPLSKGVGGARAVRINTLVGSLTVHYHRAGDIRAAVLKELEQVAGEMFGSPTEDASELMA